MGSNIISRRSSGGSAFARPNRSEGQALIEVLMACLIGALVVLALTSELSTMLRFTNVSQHQVLVSDIAQQVIDNLRNQTYSTLVANISNTPYSLLLNKTSTSQAGPSFLPRAIMLDEVANAFQTQSVNNNFQNQLTSVQVLLAASGATNVQATITVTWKEAGVRNSKSYSVSTLIAQDGIHQ
jgi:Tfp pilus assembly protein PilV